MIPTVLCNTDAMPEDIYTKQNLHPASLSPECSLGYGASSPTPTPYIHLSI